MGIRSIKAVLNMFNPVTPFGISDRYHWVDFLIPSTFQLSSYIQLLIEPLKSKETIKRVELGLHEALVNAVRHGNSCDSQKLLRVRRILTPNWLIWQIQDEGHGIPLKCRRNSLPENLEATSGRGLFMIHHCFDDVRWSKNGNRIQVACFLKN